MPDREQRTKTFLSPWKLGSTDIRTKAKSIGTVRQQFREGEDWEGGVLFNFIFYGERRNLTKMVLELTLE